MKKTRLFFLAIISIGLCAAATADLNGKWSGELVTPNFSATLTYNFKVEGTKLSGTVEGPDGTVTIDSGVINKDMLKFVITPPEGTPLPTTGKFWGDSTTVDLLINDQKFHIRLLRVK